MSTAQEIVTKATEQQVTIAVAESLTAGMCASAIADVPGASAVLLGGIVAYATDTKRDVLGVDGATLAEHGPVSPEVALAMAQAVRARFRATVGVATTGVAGPDGQDGHAPGEVFVALASEQADVVRKLELSGDRSQIRQASVQAALGLVREYLGG